MTDIDRTDLTAIRTALRMVARALAARNDPVEAFTHALTTVEAALANPRHNLPTSVSSNPDPTTDSGSAETVVRNTELNEWVSVTEASQLLGCSERRVRQIAPAIGATKRGGSWLIPRSALPEPEEQ